MSRHGFQPHSDLEASQLLAWLSDEKLQAAEVVTKLGLNPLWLAHDPDTREKHLTMAEHIVDVATVLRTGGLFVFRREDIPPPAEGLITDLPPLPFPRVWLEIVGSRILEHQFVDLDGQMSYWRGFAIIEVVPSREWRVYAALMDHKLYRESRKDRSHEDSVNLATAIREYTLGDLGDGRFGVGLGPDLHEFYDLLDKGKAHENWRDISPRVFLIPEMLIQALHTLGVIHEPITLPRARRREFQRRYGISHPSLYLVHLRGSDDVEPGSGDREYHHRWIVRGHYRLAENGSHVVPGKGVCTWVRPYVKGPAGAPWKGRPVYTTMTKEEVAAA